MATPIARAGALLRGAPRTLRSSATGRNSGILFLGNLATGALYLACSLIASHRLGPGDFGKLALFIAIGSAILTLTDLGLGTTTIRLVSRDLVSDPSQARAVQRVVVGAELVTGLAVLVVGLLTAAPLAAILAGHRPGGEADLLTVVRLGVLAGALGSAAAFVGPLLVAHGRYGRNALLTTASAAARLGGLLLLLAVGWVHLGPVLWLYAVVPLAFLLVGAVAVPRDYLRPVGRAPARAAAGEIARFGRWVLLSYLALAVGSRFDYVLLSRLRGTSAVGLYAAAVQLSSIFTLLVSAVGTVLLPQVSRLRTRPELAGYARRAVLGSLLLAVAMLPLVLLGPMLVGSLFGARFTGSGQPFQLLAAAALITLVLNPVNLVLYAVGKPRLLAYVDFAQLAATVGLHLWLIPRYGPTGAAVSGLVCTSLGALAAAALGWREIRRSPTR